ncbi:PepSY domain-containing protein, partial [Ferruginibacter sp. HRS2-29]|uniref:PepSY domain-containing protein n=1 Tax=Ferruginibacter sp. HRS2-29 TaxID=2487334 RepID=UPI0020CDB17D
YVDPQTGRQLGLRKKQNEFFQWVTSLHRSLFLHEAGRIFVGLTSFFLLLIALSGTILVIKRQRGVRRFFTKVVKDNFAQYAHVTLGRLMLIPILIIALSGTILSLKTLGIIKEKKISHKIDFDAIRSGPEIQPAKFEVFKHIKLSQVKSVEFPFSEDPEDYYTLKLDDREIVVNQLTGDILSEQFFPDTKWLTSLSMNLHTGRASAVWAVILAIAAINIVFFIWSGFRITMKRRANRVSNKYKAGKSNYIILVGSENGSTFRYAKALHEQLLKNGKTSFLTELNNYTVFPEAEHIIVITATYGLGNPPTNAKKFLQVLQLHQQTKPVHFSVVGFGSRAYPDFCKFAFEVNNELSRQQWAVPLLEIHTVNDRSPVEFGAWADIWSQKAAVPLQFSQEEFRINAGELKTFLVSGQQSMLPEEPAFLLQLQAKQRTKFTSGDLLAIYPAGDHRERLYSIGKVKGKIQLSVRLHENGLGSTYLYSLDPAATLKARIVNNDHFHFPAKAPAVIMISNGTGIAPFLGMIDENVSKKDCRLYCGFRGAASYKLYEQQLSENMANGQLSRLQVAYSREAEKKHVIDLVQQDADEIAGALRSKAVIMICGSLSMQNDVIALLENICLEKNHQAVSYYQSNGQILMDCY